MITDAANITASVGYGIKAFNYGPGNITVNELAGATITGVTDGILAEQESTFTGTTGGPTIAIDIASGATVSGNTGIFAQVTAATDATISITNSGTITSLTGATGEAIGISLAASDTAVISDTGTITGTQVVTFSGANDTLVLDQPSTFTGTISGISGSTDVLDLQGFDTGAKVSYSGTAAGGTVTVSEGSTTVHLTVAGTGIGTFVSGGLDSSGTGLLIHDPPAGSGATTIDTGATLDLTGASAQNVTFANTTGTTGSLVLNDPEGFTGQIIGFTGTAPDAVHSDTIDLVGINYDLSGFAESS